jgi:hypothetical protein
MTVLAMKSLKRQLDELDLLDPEMRARAQARGDPPPRPDLDQDEEGEAEGGPGRD